jgi:hypothetical protein
LLSCVYLRPHDFNLDVENDADNDGIDYSALMAWSPPPCLGDGLKNYIGSISHNGGDQYSKDSEKAQPDIRYQRHTL